MKQHNFDGCCDVAEQPKSAESCTQFMLWDMSNNFWRWKWDHQYKRGDLRYTRGGGSSSNIITNNYGQTWGESCPYVDYYAYYKYLNSPVVLTLPTLKLWLKLVNPVHFFGPKLPERVVFILYICYPTLYQPSTVPCVSPAVSVNFTKKGELQGGLNTGNFGLLWNIQCSF
jgi:hypothetical protein